MSIKYPQVASLGTILSIWAHPDDESWCAGGILAAAVANGQRVSCVTVTNGQNKLAAQDESRWPLAKLDKIRAAELAASLRILGIKDHQQLDYADGECHNVPPSAAADQLVPIIEQVQPDTIITFGPDGLTGHEDHRAVSGWTGLALSRAKLRHQPRLLHKAESQEWYDLIGKIVDERNNYYWKLDKPVLFPESQIDFKFNLPAELAEIKLNALRAQHSQMDSFFAKFSQPELANFASFEGFVSATDEPSN